MLLYRGCPVPVLIQYRQFKLSLDSTLNGCAAARHLTPGRTTHRREPSKMRTGAGAQRLHFPLQKLTDD